MANKLISFHNGLVTSRDPSTLQDGELVQAEGCEYREGTTHLFKQPGRASSIDNGAGPFTALGGRVKGIQHLQYDQGTDKLAVYVDRATAADGAVYDVGVYTTSATAPAPGAAEITGLTTGKIPSFAALRDRWIMVNGADPNYIREPQNVPGGATPWRLLGMQTPVTPLTLGTAPVVAGLQSRVDDFAPTANVDYASGTLAGDGNLATASIGTQTQLGTQVQDWSWTADFAGTISNGIVMIWHAGFTSSYLPWGSPNYYLGTEDVDGLQKIEVIAKPATSAVTNFSIEYAVPYGETVTVVDIGSDSLDDLLVRATTTNNLTFPGNSTSTVTGWVYEIYANNQAAQEAFTTETLSYGYTERYVDSDGITHESNISQILEVSAQTGVFGITIDGFPASPLNTFTTEYVLYRSLAEEGGGFPFMYEITTIEIGTTSYVDLGEVSFTDVTVQNSIYNTVNILYPDGATFPMEINGPPPTAIKVIPFQGSMVYVPIDSPRLRYSLPSSVSAAAIEQVPALYYLEFVTPQNDVIKSIEPGNSGRALIVYFERYSMLVNFLPQATDPGVFDQRITEYVSNTRGAAGEHATAEVTMRNGRTFAVAADALGLWSTDGVSEIHEWSNDILWQTHMTSAVFATMRLINNPLMDRLELLYDSTGANVMREFHFYYGRLKQDGEGNPAPLITGPHQASSDNTDGWQCKHYSVISSKWVGWSGDNAATATDGDIYVEREGAADASLAYDSTNTYVPFQVKTGDMYLGGLGGSSIVSFGYPKFGVLDASSKTLDPVASSNLQGFFGTFRRDGNSATATKSKAFIVGTQRKLYWHMYSDRHNIQVKDISSTAMPELVAYEIEVRDSGPGRDK